MEREKLLIRCDNESSSFALNSGSSRDTFSQSCLREICFFAAIHEFQMKGSFILGVQNRILDYLSR